MQALRRISRPVGQLSSSVIWARPFGAATWQPIFNLQSPTRQSSGLALVSAFRSSSSSEADSQVFSESDFEDLDSKTAPDYLDGPEDHGVSHLMKPWRLCDLAPTERAAYSKYGPNYLAFVKPRVRENALISMEKRHRRAQSAAKKWGWDWYTLLEEAQELQKALMAPPPEKFVALFDMVMGLRWRMNELKDEGALLDGEAPKDLRLTQIRKEYDQACSKLRASDYMRQKRIGPYVRMVQTRRKKRNARAGCVEVESLKPKNRKHTRQKSTESHGRADESGSRVCEAQEEKAKAPEEVGAELTSISVSS